MSLALAGVALAALALAPGTQAGPPRHLPCPRKGSEVIASDKLVRVYSYPPTKERYPPPRRTEACLVAGGARMTLFDPAQQKPWSHPTFAIVALAGRVLAYSLGHHGTDTGSSNVSLADIASRQILRELPGDVFVDAGILFRRVRTDFALAQSGSAAWIEEVGGARRSTTLTVYAAPRGGEVIALDEGPAIAPDSLELSAGTFSWMDAGTRRTARLTP